MQNVSTTSIAAINCCGFVSKMENGIFDQWASSFDILFVSETWISFAELKNSALVDYTPLNSNDRAPGLFASTGIFVLVKDSLADSVKEVCGKSKFIYWIHVDEKVFGKECIAGAVYLACERSRHHSADMFDMISNDLVDLKARYDLPVLLMGDFNSRTGRLSDFFPEDGFFERFVGIDGIDNRVDSAVLDDLHIPQRRANQDPATNNNGRQLVDLCREHGLLIANGRVGDDLDIGKKTCFNRNVGTSAVDLVVASPELFPCFSNFRVEDFCEHLSDTHCPIILSLHNTAEAGTTAHAPQQEARPGFKFEWNCDSGMN